MHLYMPWGVEVVSWWWAAAPLPIILLYAWWYWRTQAPLPRPRPTAGPDRFMVALRAMADCYGVPTKTLAAVDHGLVTIDGGHEAFRMVLTVDAPCCGRTLFQRIETDVALYVLHPDPLRLRADECVAHMDCLGQRLRAPCPHEAIA